MRNDGLNTNLLLGAIAAALLSACSSPSMAGPQGEPGAKGDLGPQGPAGVKGDPGLKGADGTNGANGMNGTNGADGQTAAVTPEPVGLNCLNGGVKVQVGTGPVSYVCQGAPPKYYVFVRGHLKASATDSKPIHDQIVSTVRPTVTANGDERHFVFLGLQDPQNFLAIDVWNNQAGLQAFLNDPQVQTGFGALFDAAPSITVMSAPAGYTVWGTLGPKPNTIVVSVRGTFAGGAAGNQAGHNQAAGGGEAAANSLGDYTHLAFLKTDALNTFQAVDHWNDAQGFNTFFSDPGVQAGFGALFPTGLTVDLYTPSDFAQY